MISIITCSINATTLQRMRSSVELTIGLPFELITIDNRDGKYGICEAYNIGAAKAKYDILCFVHEDVVFHTFNWGYIVCEELSVLTTGAVGLAGGDTIPALPCTWSVPARSNEINIIQHYKRSSRPVEKIMKSGSNGVKGKVIALDGVFIGTRKEIHHRYPFDAIHFPGFHGYDVDFSFQISRHFDLYVLFNIELEHFSEGQPDLSWFQSTEMFYNKWKPFLPASIHELTSTEWKTHHWTSLQVMTDHMQKLGFSSYKQLISILQYGHGKHFHLAHCVYTIARTLGLK